MRVSRKIWGGVIAGGIIGAVIGAAAMPKMSKPWSILGYWKPEIAETMGQQLRRAGKLARKWRG